MALFDRKRKGGNDDGPGGLIVGPKMTNNEEMFCWHDMGMSTDGQIASIQIFDDSEEEDGDGDNCAFADPDKVKRLLGLDHVPKLEEFIAARRAAILRKNELWEPRILLARSKGTEAEQSAKMIAEAKAAGRDHRSLELPPIVRYPIT
jgi:hypothetical protein